MATATSLRVFANGLEHHVLEWQREAAHAPVEVPRTIVLVHGFMDAAGTWDRVAPSLAHAGFRVVAPDMRGFGRGARVPSGAYYHFADYVFDLADLVEQLAPNEPVTLVGHSMGGTITTMLAGAFPERVSRLVNVEGLGPPDNPWEMGPLRMRHWVEQVRSARTRTRPPPTFTRDEALARLAANHPNVAREVLEHRLPHLAKETEPGRFAWHFDPLHRTTSPVPFFARLFVEYAKRVACPVLFVDGGPTGFHPPDEEERLAAFARLTRAVLAGAGHMVHWTQPDALASLLLDFVGGRAG